jgi:import receptor subunit TOM22
MIPPTTRLSISNKLAATASWAKWSGNTAGNLAWVLTTTALMIGLPYALAVEGEAALQAQEKEMYSKEQGQQAVSHQSELARGGEESLLGTWGRLAVHLPG